MKWHLSTLIAKDHKKIPLYQYPAPDSPRGIIHITHGMAEHSARYQLLARSLSEQGFAVFAHDHRGHGDATPKQSRGHFADEFGWELVCDDLAIALDYCAKQYPDTPLYLLGHSMGSYIALGYLMRHPRSLAGCILSGSNYGSRLLYRIARSVARIEKIRIGATTPSGVMDFIGFGAFNRKFKPNRTTFDWLSRDHNAVDQYINDPLCGFPCSSQLWIDLLGGLLEITDPAKLNKVPDIPLYIMGGDRDPVSGPKGLIQLADALKSQQAHKVTLKLYPEARHEVFNEINRDEVVNDLLQWLLSTPAMNS